MRRSIRRQFLFLRAYTIVSSLALIVGGAAAFRQASSPKEITVERLNIVDANGTLRMVISNKDRMHPGVMDGVTIDRPRPVAGMIFSTIRATTVGGQPTSRPQANGTHRADAGLTFRSAQGGCR